MTLLYIVLVTAAAGIGSVCIAALVLRFAGLRSAEPTDANLLLSFAAGALLGTAFMHLLPEAFEGGSQPAELFGTLLAGLLFFFLLDKAELWHHGHEHSHVAHGAHLAGTPDQRGHSHGASQTGGWSVLAGDSVHCFGDGILIASAFIAEWRLGLVTALAVFAHEVPHHLGDLVVLRRTSSNTRSAFVKVALAGTVTAVGGLAGWWLVDSLRALLPYFLVLASSSFMYVALADLIPQLQKRTTFRRASAQIAWLLGGILLVTMMSRLLHGQHEHENGHDHDHAQQTSPR